MKDEFFISNLDYMISKMTEDPDGESLKEKVLELRSMIKHHIERNHSYRRVESRDKEE
jgi:hypothetical protein